MKEEVRALTIRVPQSLFARLNAYCNEQGASRGEIVSYSKGVALLLEQLPDRSNGKGRKSPRKAAKKRPKSVSRAAR